jgi:ElaA protein
VLTYQLKSYEELGVDDLYQILRLRQVVFIVEQHCPYLDCDNLDQKALHLYGINDQLEVVSCARILPPGTSYDNYSSIGRIVTSPSIRRTGEGKTLVNKAIEVTIKSYPDHSIKISAQYYLLQFYQSFGFEPIGAIYLEDDIPHIAMVLDKTQ